MRLAAVLLLLPKAGQLLAQEPLETKLVIEQGGREIGREEFTLREGRGRGALGSSLIAMARYPANNPRLKLAATLEQTPEGALAKFQLEVDGPNGTTVILAAGSGARLIIRTVAKGSEAGRELPGGPDVVLLDDQVFSLYCAVADVATPAGKALTAVFPRTNRRASFVARRESGGGGGNTRVTLTGNINGTLVTDAQGRLFRLELTETGTVVSRAKD
ncbi:MAG TPA: hypothetical protein VGQ24_08550 [Gemmatimonadales bacterium]|jgi:hypothetical protein|nr:hypothetical protein [Gemmatimonadales bacterium]